VVSLAGGILDRLALWVPVMRVFLAEVASRKLTTVIPTH